MIYATDRPKAKKLAGHIGFGLCVRHVRVLKFHIWLLQDKRSEARRNGKLQVPWDNHL